MTVLSKAATPPIGNITISTSPFHIDQQSGYTGIIAGSQAPNRFYLFNADFEPVIALESDRGSPFQAVMMSDYRSFLILIERIDENLYNAHVLDLAGRLKFTLTRLSSPLDASPSGSYFYTRKSWIYGGGQPTVYDRTGQELALLSACDYWELVAANDSVLVFLNGYDVTALQIPSLTVLSHASFDSTTVGPPFPVPRISVSRTGTKFVVSAVDGLAVLDLGTGHSAMVPYPTTDGLMDLALSSDGGLLFAFFESAHGPAVYAFHGSSADIIQSGPATLAPFDSPVEFLVRRPSVTTSMCASTYSFRSSVGLGFRSLVFTFDESGILRGSVRALAGYAVLAESDSQRSATVLAINESSGNWIVRKDVTLKPTE